MPDIKNGRNAVFFVFGWPNPFRFAVRFRSGLGSVCAEIQ